METIGQKPTRFFFDNPNLSEPDRNRLIGTGKWWLSRLKLMQESDVATNIWEKTLDDGIVIRIDTSGDIDNVKIDTVNSVIGKDKTKKTTTTIAQEWVFLLSIVSIGSDLLGVLVIGQDFKTISFIKNDGTDIFAGFENWNKYYGFIHTWGDVSTPAGHNVLAELPRRSEMSLLEVDADYSNEETDTDWQPGQNPDDWTTNLPYQPVQLYYGTWIMDCQDGYEVDNGDGTYTVYGNHVHFYDITYAAYNYPAYNDSEYTIRGIGATFDNWYRFRHFQLISFNVRREVKLKIGVPGAWLYFHLRYEDEDVQIDVWPFPSDGVQRREETNIWTYASRWYFEANGDTGQDVFSQEASHATTYTSWVEGVWSNDSETTETQAGEEYSYPVDDCCTLVNPDECLPNEIYNDFEKWIILNEKTDAYNESIAFSPCKDSSYWQTHSRPHIHIEDTFTSKIWFDDGHIEVMGEGDVYNNYEPAYGSAESIDMSVYNLFSNNNPIYVGHYHFPGAGGESALFYYTNGEFKISKKYRESSATEWQNYFIDAFDSLSKYGGYWNGQVRVGILTKTKKEDIFN